VKEGVNGKNVYIVFGFPWEGEWKARDGNGKQSGIEGQSLIVAILM
jgi:hypothetical protein